MYEIIKKQILNKDVDLMVIHAPMVAKNALPGHFIILRVNETGERIPLTIVDIDGENITIIYQKLGYTTKLLGQLNIGDKLVDFVGPLGKAAHIRDVKNVLGIAGGVGAAPLLPQLKEYNKRGIKVDLVIGARSKEYIILLDQYKKYCENIYIATDDGSLGTKGFVTDVLTKLYKEKKYDHTIAIGPLIMMKFVVILNKKYNIPTDVSLNPVMVDGTGMCGNCRVSINGKTFFACIDGPDFPGEGVNFDELIARQDYYHEEEDHICKMKLVTK
ncbi:MAG: sulfide/dihydroorotate dehydrogenase-like FAD/NAD-binding protein [Candidatus Izimaplasma sp.]|nr:sulfide/dihydroorotate dehydrogenase-like FAD/NAD-binding protein [Candidatus Izimaplasma bacterium]